jgi:hypothetical protein
LLVDDDLAHRHLVIIFSLISFQDTILGRILDTKEILATDLCPCDAYYEKGKEDIANHGMICELHFLLPRRKRLARIPTFRPQASTETSSTFLNCPKQLASHSSTVLDAPRMSRDKFYLPSQGMKQTRFIEIIGRPTGHRNIADHLTKVLPTQHFKARSTAEMSNYRCRVACQLKVLITADHCRVQ